MGWGYGNRGGKSDAILSLPHFSTYAEAKKRYDNTKQIRGSDDVRPLGRRKEGHSFRIVEGTDQVLPTPCPYVAAKMYSTECVRWIKPETTAGAEAPQVITIATGGWHSPSTAAFIDQVLPSGLRAAREGGKVRVNGLIVSNDHSMQWSRSNGEGWVLKDEVTYQEYTHKLNMPVANALKKQHKAFRNWLKGVISLKEYKFNRTEALAALGLPPHRSIDVPNLIGNKDPEVKQRLMDLLNAADSDPEKYAKWMTVAGWIALVMGHTPWAATESERVVIMNHGVSSFDKVLLALHADAVLVRTPLPLGKVRKDTYARW